MANRSLFSELKRRNVFRVGLAYLVASWLLIQLTDVLVPMLVLPEWVSRFIFLLLIVLAIPVLIAAWALELTPDGIKLEKNVVRDESNTAHTGKRLDRIIIGVLAVLVISLLVDRVFISGSDETPQATGAGVDKSIAVLPFADLCLQRRGQKCRDYRGRTGSCARPRRIGAAIR